MNEISWTEWTEKGEATAKLVTETKEEIFLVYSLETGLWCLCGTKNGLYWETDDYAAEGKEQALEDALEYLKDYDVY